MAMTDTKSDAKKQDPVTKRPGSGPDGDSRPLQQTEGPLADAQHDGTQGATNAEEHEGATEAQVGDRGGPGVGFDQEPEREKDEGGVS
jgi:hypothetical protein